MRLFLSDITPFIAFFGAKKRSTAAPHPLAPATDAAPPHCGLVPSAEETRPGAPTLNPSHREGALTDGRSPSPVRPCRGGRTASRFTHRLCGVDEWQRIRIRCVESLNSDSAIERRDDNGYVSLFNIKREPRERLIVLRITRIYHRRDGD